MTRSNFWTCAALTVLLAGCGDGDTASADADAAPADTTDATTTSDAADAADATDTAEPPRTLTLAPTIQPPPTDPLAGAAVESCGVIDSTRCDAGTLQRCALYDAGSDAFVASPDPLLRRALLYDRWHDLYGSPDGQTAERRFNVATPPEAPESEWGDPARFDRYAGRGDAAIWTGVALNSDAFRYAVTGTDADYARMVAKTEALLSMFDVTGVPGMLARHHFLRVPAGTPRSDQHFISVEGEDTLSNRDVVIDAPETIAGLPAAYLDGVPDGSGGTVKGVPMWHSRLSIDQYTGPMAAFPVVYDLLRPADAGLRDRMAEHLVCYLNRLQRLELTNLQENPQVKQLLTDFFAGSGNLDLDPDDIDLNADTVVIFYHRGRNPENGADFDASCPAGPPRAAVRTLNGGDTSFLGDVLGVVSSLNFSDDTAPADQIDHAYAPTLRGGDASHLMHLAVIAYQMTGERTYLDFLFDDLIDGLDLPGVALTMQAFRPPDWCISFYGDHISYATHWQLITMLPADSPLRAKMVRAMDEELWQKALANHGSAKFDVMYAAVGAADGSDLSARDTALARAVETLRAFGGGGFDATTIDSPRRTYALDRQDILSRMMAADLDTRCPTEDERARCEEGVSVFGQTLGGEIISYTCDGGPGQCTMADGMCTDAIASEGLPPRWRPFADFMWQRDPFQIGDGGNGGKTQSPGRDLTEPYWLARYYGFITEGAGQVLAWQSDGSCASQ